MKDATEATKLELNKKLDNARKIMTYLRKGNIGDKELLDFVLYLIGESKKSFPVVYEKIKEAVK